MAKKNLSCLWSVVFTLLAFALMFFAAILQGHAQSAVIRQGNMFYQQPSKKTIQKDSAVTLTQYVYVIKDVKYPVYKSSRGAYFIIRTNKEGKQYRDYITKKIKHLLNG